MPNISIIIPTYNEAENIGTLLDRIRKSMQSYSYQIVVVDDNSPDGTFQIVREHSKKDNRILPMCRLGRKGLSSAVIEGFEYTQGSIWGVMDADLSHPPEIIPEMVDAIKLGNYDLVVAERNSVEGWSLARKAISRTAKLLARPLTKIKDPMSGFFFFKKEILQYTKLNPIGYKILLEILVKGNIKHIRGIPYTFKNRNSGKSKLNIKTQLQYLIQLMGLYRWKMS